MKAELILGGGCFWGMQELFRHQPGVLQTEVGYCGGQSAQPSYEEVKTGRTGHAEVLKIIYDSQVTSLDGLLRYFFKIHDPTTEMRQGNDRGSQYRSIIFYQSEAEKSSAQNVMIEVEKKGHWKNPIVTELVALAPYTPAEEYHQDYLQKHPQGYTCHFERPFSF